jgi:hypothetical protein
MGTMLAYGFFGDIIKQSNKWRSLGPLRYDLAGFFQFLRNESYHCDVTLTLSSYDSSQLPPSSATHSMSHTVGKTTSSVAPDPSQLINHDNSLNNVTDDKDTLSQKLRLSMAQSAATFCCKNCDTCVNKSRNERDENYLSSQIKREGRYRTINCLNMPCRCAKSKLGMSPYVHLGKIDCLLTITEQGCANTCFQDNSLILS